MEPFRVWNIIYFNIRIYVFDPQIINKPRLEILSDRNVVRVVEGNITNYILEPWQSSRSNQTTESFVVDSLKFHINDATLTSFGEFDKTHQNGGILNNGLQVRITYNKENMSILKCELAQ